jgi:hypothetical protein
MPWLDAVCWLQVRLLGCLPLAHDLPLFVARVVLQLDFFGENSPAGMWVQQRGLKGDVLGRDRHHAVGGDSACLLHAALWIEAVVMMAVDLARHAGEEWKFAQLDPPCLQKLCLTSL